MSEETSTAEQGVEFQLKGDSKSKQKSKISPQDLVDALKSVQDDIGQITELTSEEELLVTEFFSSLQKFMEPLASSIPVSTKILPKEMQTAVQAYLDATGQLALLYEDERMELKNLSEQEHRDLMIAVIEDVTPKFTQLTEAQKRKVENRIKLLSMVTKEMQKITKATSSPSGSQK
jgi:hypothetical protein